MSINYKNVGGKITEAKTLMARDWKGFGAGHELSNGVVETKSSV